MRAVVLVAAHQARTLAGLAEWPPAGVLVESVLDAAKGEGGLDRFQLRRISKWSTRWERCPEHLRAFYEAVAGDTRAGPALWHMLDDKPEPRGRVLGRLYWLWREHHGQEARGPIIISLLVDNPRAG